jgi:cytochrome c biogenesis protein CcmG, thiol:disulfide interchange protein DsbE
MSRVAAGLLTALALVAGCGTATPSGSGGMPSGGMPSSAAADSQALAAARAKADLGPCPQPGAEPAPRAALPDLTLPCLGGGPDVPLARLGGVPMVINAWASWCVPCRAELPAFEQVASAVDGSRLRMLGVDTQDSPAAALDFAAARGVHLPTVVDSTGKLKASQRAPGLPFTLFVRADGSIASVHVGPLTYEDLKAEVEQQLGVPVA